MSDYKEIKHPLFGLFDAARKKFALQLDDYYDFLTAIESGIGVQSEQSMLSLCKLLWLKDIEQSKWFEEQFSEELKKQKLLIGNLFRVSESAENEQPPTDLEDKPPEEKDKTQNKEEILPEKNVEDNKPSKNKNYETTEYDTVYLSVGNTEIDKEKIEGDRKQIKENYSFSFAPRNFIPFDERILQINWRNLRNMVFEPEFETIDTDACVNDIAQKGVLTQLFYKHHPKNKVQAVTIIDNLGSMAVFRWQSKQINQIISSEINNKTYYCYNLPEPVLFEDKEFNKKVKWDNSYQKIVREKYVIIISDAGAAKGTYSSQRVERTEKILEQIRKSAKNVVWLNPMPEKRWRKTSAIYISLSVRMFEISEKGVLQAIEYLKSNHTYQPFKEYV